MSGRTTTTPCLSETMIKLLLTGRSAMHCDFIEESLATSDVDPNTYNFEEVFPFLYGELLYKNGQDFSDVQ